MRQIHLIMVIYRYLIWGTVTFAAITHAQNSTTTPPHHKVFSDSKTSTQSPILKFKFLPLDLFNKTIGSSTNFTTIFQQEVSTARNTSAQQSVVPDTVFVPPLHFNERFDFPEIPNFGTVRPNVLGNEVLNFTKVGRILKNHKEKEIAVADDITRHFKDLPPLHIPRWTNLAEPNFQIPKYSVNVKTEKSSFKTFSVIGGGGGFAAFGGGYAAYRKKKSRNNGDNEPGEEGIEQNDTVLMIETNDEGQRSHSSNRNVIDV
ncbi:uncharacterized protein LOC135137401 [Zophobas morio]|uniref:uncharacterized protein LOC135137401 n=1 Tax=Zophobas morio TaxID=2755281 RepID=UPI003083C4DA